METAFGPTRLRFLEGDIALQDTEAVVIAAKGGLIGEGGLDCAILRAGGPRILEECREIVARQGPCATGKAVLTQGGLLPAAFVIHTVAPLWRGGGYSERELLAECYRNVLRVAAAHGIRSVSFPAIGTGASRFPQSLAAPIALRAVAEGLPAFTLEEVRFVLRTAEELSLYMEAWRRVLLYYRPGKAR
ncbi:MAG: macro domain-containing protein [Bacteroidota bacterium]